MVLLFLLVSWNGANKKVLLGPISLMPWGTHPWQKCRHRSRASDSLSKSPCSWSPCYWQLMVVTTCQCDKSPDTDTITSWSDPGALLWHWTMIVVVSCHETRTASFRKINKWCTPSSSQVVNLFYSYSLALSRPPVNHFIIFNESSEGRRWGRTNFLGHMRPDTDR